jgi:hypothetical protein
VPVLVVDDVDQEQELVLEDLSREQVIDWRARAAHDHQMVFDHINRYGETSARRLFTSKFVDQVQRLAGLGHLGLGHLVGAGVSGGEMSGVDVARVALRAPMGAGLAGTALDRQRGRWGGR